MATPPLDSAGKNFRSLQPSERPASISLGVATPGTNGRPTDCAYLRVCGFRPGATANAAPALLAASTFPALSTVPAPTINLGRSLVILRMASAAAAVRKVISTTG